MSTFSLTQQQRQQQILSHQQQQNLDLLQTNSMELLPHIRAEADCNPAIDLVEPRSQVSLDAEREAYDRQSSSDWDDAFDAEESELSIKAPLPDTSAAESGPVFEPNIPDDRDFASSTPLPAGVRDDDAREETDAGDVDLTAATDSGLASLAPEDVDYLFSNGDNNEYSPEAEERRQFFFDSQTSEENLSDHLLHQLEGERLSPLERQIAEQIVGEIDENGYFKGSTAEIAQGLLLDDVGPVENILRRIQALDPVGVGGRDARECMLLQILAEPDEGSAIEQFAPETRDLAARILSDPESFEALAFRRFSRLERRYKTEDYELEEVLELVRVLNPKPGSAISAWKPILVTPEIIVRKDPATGRWVTELDESNLPRLSVNAAFRAHANALDKAVRASAKLRRPPKGESAPPEIQKADRDYARKCIADAEALINGVRLRQLTLGRVAALVVEHQQAFFDSGNPADIRPLVMADIAKQIGIHETTVSRAVSGKFARWPGGIVEIRKLFTARVSSNNGENLSGENIKGIIRDLIDREDPSAPLSDQEIVRLLSERGIQCARRTVAKYRDQMRILPSSQRKS